MTKGYVHLKPHPYHRWVNVFKAWINSGHIAVVIHCESHQQCRNVQKSAVSFKARYKEKFWTHQDGSDLYLIREDAIKHTAMEVKQNKDGVIYFYDSTNVV